MHLFFDTETADLPRRRDAPASDVHNWPRVVQLAWVSCDSKGNPGTPRAYLIKPDGFVISRGAYERHGISTEEAVANGVPLKPALAEFLEAVQAASVGVAHNVAFDAKVLGAEFIRAGMPNVLDRKQLRCTMKESVEYCKLPGNYGYKWPTLTELHTILFGKSPGYAHDATADCLACMRCFFRLKELNVIA